MENKEVEVETKEVEDSIEDAMDHSSVDNTQTMTEAFCPLFLPTREDRACPSQWPETNQALSITRALLTH
jgi:hypothetical protein